MRGLSRVDSYRVVCVAGPVPFSAICCAPFGNFCLLWVVSTHSGG